MDIRAIDVHAHFGRSVDQACDLVNDFMTADAEGVARLASLSNVEYTFVSPLSAFYKSDVLAANIETARSAAKHKGLLFWTVVNPLMPETLAQAREMLENPSYVGMKIHPELHNYRIEDHGDTIFKFAAEHNTIIQTHSGCPNSEPLDFVRFADNHPEARLIISHLGNHWDGDVTRQVRAIEKSAHGNIFTDTSSAKSIIPNLIEWAVKEVGADKILFGTDSPLYFAPVQRARIDHSLLTTPDKSLILRENALSLFSNKLV